MRKSPQHCADSLGDTPAQGTVEDRHPVVDPTTSSHPPHECAEHGDADAPSNDASMDTDTDTDEASGGCFAASEADASVPDALSDAPAHHSHDAPRTHPAEGASDADATPAHGDRLDPAHGDQGRTPATYAFTFSEDNLAVTAVAGTKGDVTRTLDVAGSTFATTIGFDPLGAPVVTAVTQTFEAGAFKDVFVYTDADGDGAWDRSFGIAVASVADATLPVLGFEIDAGGVVTPVADDEACPAGHAADEVVYTQASLDSDTYVIATRPVTDGYFFKLFRDDNGDGLWSEVAHGSSAGEFVDADTGAVDLVGIGPWLAAADPVIG